MHNAFAVVQHISMQTSMHSVKEASRMLTALVKNTPAKLQTSPTHQMMIIHKERPSELPLMKLMMICGRQHTPINTTEAKPKMKEVRSVVLHMQSPNVLAQVAQPGSHMTPIRLAAWASKPLDTRRYCSTEPSLPTSALTSAHLISLSDHVDAQH